MERKLTVRVDLLGGGNLASKLAEAGKAADKLKGKGGNPFADLRSSRAADIQKMERQLAYSKTTQGANQIITQNRVATQLAKQQDWLARVAEKGRIGAWAGAIGERANQVSGVAGRVAGAGMGLAAGALASGAPAAWEQVTNSARYLMGELAIGLIPSAVRLSYYLQQGAHWIRNLNQATNGWAGNLAGYAIAGSAVIWAGSRVVGLLGTGVSIASGLARWVGVASAAAPVSATAGAAAGGGIAALAGPLAILAGLAIPIYSLTRDISSLNNPNSPRTNDMAAPLMNWAWQLFGAREAPQPVQQYGGVAAWAADIGNRWFGGTGAQQQGATPTQMNLLGRGLSWLGNATGSSWLGSAGNGLSGMFGGGNSNQVMNMMNRNPRLFDLSQLYDQFVMAAQPDEPIAIALQQLEVQQATLDAINELNTQMNSQGGDW